MARILIADDHPIYLSGLRAFLEAHGHNIVACTSSADEAIKALDQSDPDLLMVDVYMSGGGGLKVLEHVKQGSKAVPVIFLSVGIEGNDTAEALQLGINGMLLKNNEPEAMLKCIDTVLRGESWFEDEIIDLMIAQQQRPKSSPIEGVDNLSPREHEIVGKVVSGARNREIANEFGITEGTVKVHLHRIYRKLGITSRSELVVMVLGRAR